jgi:hypothetical protein
VDASIGSYLWEPALAPPGIEQPKAPAELAPRGREGERAEEQAQKQRQERAQSQAPQAFLMRLVSSVTWL